MIQRILLCLTTSLAFAAFSAILVRADEPAKDSVQVRAPAIVPQPVSVEKLGGKPFTSDAITILQAIRSIRKATGQEPNHRPRKRIPARMP